MNLMSWLGLILVVALLAYLLVALLFPEMFE